MPRSMVVSVHDRNAVLRPFGRSTAIALTVILVGSLAGIARAGGGRFTLNLPSGPLQGVPVPYVEFSLVLEDGTVDVDYSGTPTIEGVEIRGPNGILPMPSFSGGRLRLETDLLNGQRVALTSSTVTVSDGDRTGRFIVSRLWPWLSLVPPILAIVLAVWSKSVLIALFCGVWSGATIISGGNPATGVLKSLDPFLLQALVQPDAGSNDHMLIILFTTFLGAMIGVMSRSGGTLALVNRLARFTTRREHGQLLTCGLGTVVFFDDYANTMLVGSTMRPVTDRLGISREKLAFLVDSTAAPIAGLALVSTWVGFEVGQIETAFDSLSVDVNAFALFVKSWPYRAYSILLLVFVVAIAWSGRDFGSMLTAERTVESAVNKDVPSVPNDAPEPPRLLVRNAIVPLVTLVGLLATGLWWTGVENLRAENAALPEESQLALSAANILGASSSTRVLFVSSFLASVTAVIVASTSRTLSLIESVEAWMSGARNMVLPLFVLVLAWSLSMVCSSDHLNTAGYLVDMTHGFLDARWMPALAFLLSAGVSFATGSSFSTMGLLLPLTISMTYNLLSLDATVQPDHHLLLATIGSVLAGSIFGDHCSPISDTTVLSSAAAGCDHLRHVATQLPYALTVGMVALVLGYIPLGFGAHPLIVLLLGAISLVLIVRFVGRRATH